MNKKQLEEKILAKYGTILTTLIVNDWTIGNVKGYKAIVLEKTEDGCNQIAIPYYVENEGKENEFADVMTGYKSKILPAKTVEEIEAERLEQAVSQKVFEATVTAEVAKRLE